MDISLEKIDIIRDRTGVSYKEAKEALEAAGGDVVDALINIEQTNNKRWTETLTESISVKGVEAMDKVKSIINAGNVSRIRVKKDEYVILDIPVTAGAIGAVAIPLFTAIGATVALLTKCTIEIERPNKEIITVNEVITNTADDITSRIKNVASEFKKTTNDTQPKEEENIENYNNQTSAEFNTTINEEDNSYKQ